jgi:hypothetical protein
MGGNIVKKHINLYLDRDVAEEVKKRSKNNERSLSGEIRRLVKIGLAQVKHGGSTAGNQQPTNDKPTNCPECGQKQDELGNPTLTVNESGTWYCRACNSSGRWDS